MKTKLVEFKVEKNERYGDYRVHEYFNGEWNNQIDNNWSESQANKIKDYLQRSLIALNGSMKTADHSATTLDLADSLFAC